jgi:hypothetical protein
VSILNAISDITPAMLEALGDHRAVLVFRELLWAQARRKGAPINGIHISEKTDVADGGIDAVVDAGLLHGADELLRPGTSFQIKAGATCKPWTKGWIKKELFGPKPVARENLAPRVRACMEQERRYVLVCFGVDLTPDDQLPRARLVISSILRECGFYSPHVEVWGQSHVIGLLRPYLAIRLAISGRSDFAFQTHALWSRRSEMQPALHLGDAQRQFIDEIGDLLRDDQVGHVHIIGEPGVGKSRLVLEATSAPDLQPLVIFVDDGEELLQSALLRTLIRDASLFAILVVDDNCPPRTRASLWNQLNPFRTRVRLITLDHGPERPRGESMMMLDAPPLSDESVAAIIRDYVSHPLEAARWAKLCGGSPRFAHLVGENLRRHPEDVFQEPATVNVWDRIICGRDDHSSLVVDQRRTVLRHIALFERFGFESPVVNEAEFIAALVSKTDPSITWPRFQAIVCELRHRRILQGKRTLYITPTVLQVYLYREYWENHGRGSTLCDTLEQLPSSLWQWFTEMLRYAHTSEVGNAAVKELLSRHGLFPSDSLPDSQRVAKLISVVAETCPEETLSCLRRTIGSWDVNRRREYSEGRHWIIEALEKLVVWDQLFDEAAELILDLAEAENSRYANNASGTFASLFSLRPALSATEASPSRRLPVLTRALLSPSPARRELALEACRNALLNRSMSRFVGSEQQGVRPRANLWLPKTQGELWTEYRAIWQLLVGMLDSWPVSDRPKLAKTLIEAARTMIQIPGAEKSVLTVLKRLVDDTVIDRRDLVKLFNNFRLYLGTRLPATTRSSIAALGARLEGKSIRSGLRRYVELRDHDDDREDREQRGRVAKKLQRLALDAQNHPRKLSRELPWLVRDKQGYSFDFGLELGRLDADTQLCGAIIRAVESAGDEWTPPFLAGYLAAIAQRNKEKWEEVMLGLLQRKALRRHIGGLIQHSFGYSDRVAEPVIELVERGAIGVEQFAQWRYPHWLQGMDERLFARMQELLLRSDAEWALSVAIEQFHWYYVEDKSRTTLPEDLAFRVLTHERLFEDAQDPSIDYSWSRVADRFAAVYPHRALDLLTASLSRLDSYNSIFAHSSHAHASFERLVSVNPTAAWNHIVDLLDDLRSGRAWMIQHWLGSDGARLVGDNSAGAIRLFPRNKVWDWIDDDIDQRVFWVLRVLPKSLTESNGGDLTQDFICRYGHDPEVLTALRAHFMCEGYWGNASDHYRRKRDTAQSHLRDNSNFLVTSFLNRYIESLNHEIESAELEEERDIR